MVIASRWSTGPKKDERGKIVKAVTYHGKLVVLIIHFFHFLMNIFLVEGGGWRREKREGQLVFCRGKIEQKEGE